MIDRAAGNRDVESIVEEVRRWDASQRIELARRVLETLEPPQISPPPRRIPLE